MIGRSIILLAVVTTLATLAPSPLLQAQRGTTSSADYRTDRLPVSGSHSTFGVPETTFTIPYPAGGGLYLPDIQQAYPNVNWTTLDRLYLSAGHYRFINIGNLPQRDPARPLVISNTGGQVWVGALDMYYLFKLSGGSNWVLTGQYDPIARTGDAAFPGHQGNDYTDTRGTYGILIDDDFGSPSGLAIGGRATDFEVSFLEIREVGFAGILMKTDDDGTALMRNVRLHDLYIHDTEGEGLYIGSTQTPPQHPIEGLEIFNSRILRTATEALQVGQLGSGTNIHHNVFALAALDWKDAFQRYQDANSQIKVRYGRGAIHHNVFIGAASMFISFFGSGYSGDPHQAGDYMLIHDNYYASFRDIGSYIGGEQDGVTAFRLERNVFRGFRFQYNEVYPDVTEANFLFAVAASVNPVVLRDNQFESPPNLTNRFTGVNGTAGNVSASGNIRGTVPPVQFNNFGFPPDFDYLRVELWTDLSRRNNNAPVYYEPDDYVMHQGQLYRNIGGRHTGLVPDMHPEVWQLQQLPPDDVRLAPSSPYQGIGLLDQAPVFQQNFESATSVPAYYNATNPTTSQFNDLSSEANGGTWSVGEGRLRLVRTASSGDDNDAGITRHTDFAGPPTLLHIAFDLGVSNWTNSPFQSNAMLLSIGKLGSVRDYGAGDVAADTFQTLSVNGRGPGQFVFATAGADSALLAADGTLHHAELFLNKSATTASYRAPNGTLHNVGAGGVALWVNGALVVETSASNGSTSSLTDLRLRFSSADNATWQLDNIVIHNSFPE